MPLHDVGLSVSDLAGNWCHVRILLIQFSHNAIWVHRLQHLGCICTNILLRRIVKSSIQTSLFIVKANSWQIWNSLSTLPLQFSILAQHCQSIGWLYICLGCIFYSLAINVLRGSTAIKIVKKAKIFSNGCVIGNSPYAVILESLSRSLFLASLIC